MGKKLHFMLPDRGGGHLRGATCIKCVNNVKHDLRKARLTIASPLGGTTATCWWCECPCLAPEEGGVAS